MASTMQHYTDHLGEAPVIVLAAMVRYREPTPFEGASVYPACQNLLLAARAIGLGGVLTQIQLLVDEDLTPCSPSPTRSSCTPPSPSATRPEGTGPCGAGP